MRTNKMKILLLTAALTITIQSLSYAQKIDIEKVFGGYKYTQNSELKSLRDIASIIETNTTAFKLIKKGRANRNLAALLSFTGGGLLGWSIGSALGGGEQNWTLAGIGGGLIGIGIPISLSANKKIHQSVALYNASLKPNAFNSFKPNLKIVTNTNGFGLAINF